MANENFAGKQLTLDQLCVNAILLDQAGQADEAIKLNLDIIEENPDLPRPHVNLAEILLRRGEFIPGWSEYEWIRRVPEYDVPKINVPRWNGMRLRRGRLLLIADQGYGDSIQFARYIPYVAERCLEVDVACETLLEPILHTVSGVNKTFTRWDSVTGIFRAYCNLSSLPYMFGTTLETIPNTTPYIRADLKKVIQWETYLRENLKPNRLRVGVCWAGRSTHPFNQQRSMKLEQWLPLLNLEGVSYVALQKDISDADREVISNIPNFINPADRLNDFSDTAALIENLDLVISVDTSVVHLTGALGKPVWVLLPWLPDWRWMLNRDDSPWYPGARLFRQPVAGDWQSVMAGTRDELQKVMYARAANTQRIVLPAKEPAPSRAKSVVLDHNEVTRRRNKIKDHETDIARWSNEAQLETAWDERARRAGDYIPAGAVVLDLGCGRMSVERFLPNNCQYIPCDVSRRDERTVICDFNKQEYPDAEAGKADIVSILGVLEYIFDAKAFLSHLRRWNRPVLMSYCATDGIGDSEHRRNLGWVNDYTYDLLVALLKEVGFTVHRADRIDAVQWILLLHPGAIALPSVKRVAVLSYYNDGNFGDRLGYHLINDILPPNAQVTHLSFKPWIPVEENYDLLVLGIGNSLFGKLINEDVLSFIDRSKNAIGIFGTQYHDITPLPLLDKLLGKLGHWYARYEEDVLRYGRGRDNVSHLGDWMIGAFPMAKPTTAERLNIGDEVLRDLPLDRTIQAIQRHATVFSTRLHPLLCALTSAERVGYREQREITWLVSGKFRSLLLDVFGRSFPEEELWDVDRDAVLTYKCAVDSRVQELRAFLHSLLM